MSSVPHLPSQVHSIKLSVHPPTGLHASGSQMVDVLPKPSGQCSVLLSFSLLGACRSVGHHWPPFIAGSFSARSLTLNYPGTQYSYLFPSVFTLMP